MILGYKCFNSGLVNAYGNKFIEGGRYHCIGDIKFATKGFHMCANLEDTLRYFDALNGEVEIARVLGTGKIDEYEDEYNGYYNMYATENIEILHVLTRDEIIEYALQLSPERVKRFVSLYRLTTDEIELFKEKFANCLMVLLTIEYYQQKNDKAFQKIK